VNPENSYLLTRMYLISCAGPGAGWLIFCWEREGDGGGGKEKGWDGGGKAGGGKG